MNPILVPVRNGLHLTRNAVADFLAQDIGDVQVLVINNASEDGTTEWLRTQNVSTMHMTPPRSVAESWNRGLKWCWEQGAEYCLVVNNDTRLRPDCFRLLVEDGGCFVTAVGSNDPKCVEFRPPLPAKGFTLAPHQDPYPMPDPEKKRPHPDFSCFLIRKCVWDKIGPFSEEFAGGYCEDGDYHLRMHEAGVDAYCLDLPFWHLGAGTIRCFDKEESGQRDACAIRHQADANRKLFKEKHGVDVGSTEYYKLFGHSDPEESKLRRAKLLVGEDALQEPTEERSEP